MQTVTSEPATTVETTSVDKMSELEKRFTAQEQQSSAALATAAQSQLLAQFMGDPDFAAVFNARQTGKKVKVVEDQPLQPTEPVKLTEEDMKDPQKVVDHIRTETVRSLAPQLQEMLKPLQQQLSQVVSTIEDRKIQETKSEIAKLQERFPDFDEFRPQMVALNKQFGGAANAQQLYVLAKTAAGAPITTNKRTDTERPSSETTRPAKPTKQYPQGRLGIQQMMHDSLSKLDFSKVGDMLPNDSGLDANDL